MFIVSTHICIDMTVQAWIQSFFSPLCWIFPVKMCGPVNMALHTVSDDLVMADLLCSSCVLNLNSYFYENIHTTLCENNSISCLIVIYHKYYKISQMYLKYSCN